MKVIEKNVYKNGTTPFFILAGILFLLLPLGNIIYYGLNAFSYYCFTHNLLTNIEFIKYNYNIGFFGFKHISSVLGIFSILAFLIQIIASLMLAISAFKKENRPVMASIGFILYGLQYFIYIMLEINYRNHEIDSELSENYEYLDFILRSSNTIVRLIILVFLITFVLAAISGFLRFRKKALNIACIVLALVHTCYLLPFMIFHTSNTYHLYPERFCVTALPYITNFFTAAILLLAFFCLFGLAIRIDIDYILVEDSEE